MRGSLDLFPAVSCLPGLTRTPPVLTARLFCGLDVASVASAQQLMYLYSRSLQWSEAACSPPQFWGNPGCVSAWSWLPQMLYDTAAQAGVSVCARACVCAWLCKKACVQR